ncbi:UNVERIFIED_CONTAM: DHH family phosphoesterase [Microbacterium sp. SLM126]
MTRIAIRSHSHEHAGVLAAAGLHPTLARILSARGVLHPSELATDLPELVPPSRMKGIGHAATYLADAIAAGRKLLIVADYDCDGATACAVGVRGLRMLGARVDYIVPNRFEYGYGLTPEIVELAARQQPDVIVTVDNGIASVDGVAAANARGIDVVVTDHHLPGAVLPDAAVIVNPNQPGCEFPSKNLAGVGVMFYVLLALRAELRQRGVYTKDT